MDSNLSNFKDLSSGFREIFPQLVDFSDFQTPLSNVCEYALFPGGKCVRAGLVLFVAKQLGLEVSKLYGFAATVELLHASSLVHDDLPAIDNDALRRGQPSVHKKFGEAQAILAGDALISLAFINLEKHLRAEFGETKHCTLYLELSTLLNKAYFDVCQGQLLDVLAAGTSNQVGQEVKDLLNQRHCLKTAALIQAALRGPTRFLEQKQRLSLDVLLSDFGLQLGLLFQITDDLLEVNSANDELGKDSDSDMRKGVSTYLSVYGVEESKKLAAKVATEARRLLESSEQLCALSAIVDYVENRTS